MRENFLWFYELILIKIAIAKKISNTPTTINAIFKISEIVEDFEPAEMLLTLVESCESVEEKVFKSADESSTVELDEAVDEVYVEFEFTVDVLPTELFIVLLVLLVLLFDVVTLFPSIYWHCVIYIGCCCLLRCSWI